MKQIKTIADDVEAPEVLRKYPA